MSYDKKVIFAALYFYAEDQPIRSNSVSPKCHHSPFDGKQRFPTYYVVVGRESLLSVMSG